MSDYAPMFQMLRNLPRQKWNGRFAAEVGDLVKRLRLEHRPVCPALRVDGAYDRRAMDIVRDALSRHGWQVVVDAR